MICWAADFAAQVFIELLRWGLWWSPGAPPIAQPRVPFCATGVSNTKLDVYRIDVRIFSPLQVRFHQPMASTLSQKVRLVVQMAAQS